MEGAFGTIGMLDHAFAQPFVTRDTVHVRSARQTSQAHPTASLYKKKAIYTGLFCAPKLPHISLPHSTLLISHSPVSTQTYEPGTSGICSRDQPKIHRKLAENRQKDENNRGNKY